MEIFRDIDQNSDAWKAIRCGIITASKFQVLMVKNDTKAGRSTYLHQLAGEIITGEPMASFTNVHTERGHEQEGDARDLYVFNTGNQVERVGFIRNGRKGASPDCLIGDDGGAEIKTRLANLQAELLIKGEVPNSHVAQIQGTMWVSGRKWWDFVSYCPKMPLFVKRVARDESYIQKLATEVDKFNGELDAVVAKIRACGEAVAA